MSATFKLRAEVHLTSGIRTYYPEIELEGEELEVFNQFISTLDDPYFDPLDDLKDEDCDLYHRIVGSFMHAAESEAAMHSRHSVSRHGGFNEGLIGYSPCSVERVHLYLMEPD